VASARGSFCFYPTFYSSCDCKSRYHQSWTLTPTPIRVFAAVALLRFALFLQSLPLLTRAIPSMSEALCASNSSSLITLPISWPGRRYLESDITAENDKRLIMVVGIGIGAVASCTKKLFKISEFAGGATSYAARYLRNKYNIDVRADEPAIPSKPLSLFNSIITAATAAVVTGQCFNSKSRFCAL
jgi:hypothetical protein